MRSLEVTSPFVAGAGEGATGNATGGSCSDRRQPLLHHPLPSTPSPPPPAPPPSATAEPSSVQCLCDSFYWERVSIPTEELPFVLRALAFLSVLGLPQNLRLERLQLYRQCVSLFLDAFPHLHFFLRLFFPSHPLLLSSLLFSSLLFSSLLFSSLLFSSLLFSSLLFSSLPEPG